MGIAKSDKIISIPKANARISFFIHNSTFAIYVVQGVRFELTYS
jgi:predicted lipase